MALHTEVRHQCQVGDEVKLRFVSGVTIAGIVTRLDVSRRFITFVLTQCRASSGGVIACAPESYEFTIKTGLAELVRDESGLYIVSNRCGLNVYVGQSHRS